nr:ABC transporter ATP-binding protein [Anaerolineae bacterium]
MVNTQALPLSTREKITLLWPGIRWALRTVWQMAPWWLSARLVLTLVPSGLLALQALFARQFINELVGLVTAEAGDFRQVVTWLVLGAGVEIAREVVSGLKQYVSQRINEMLQIDITLQVLEHASHLDVAAFEDPASQDLLERAQQNMFQNVSSFINQFFDAATQIVSVISVIAILVVIDPIATLIIVPIAIPYIVFHWSQANARYEKERNRTTKRRWTRYYSSTLIGNDSIREVKLLNLAPLLMQRYREVLEGFIQTDRKLYTRQIVGGIIFSIVFAIAILLISAWIAWRVFKGTLTIGDMTIYARAAGQLQSMIVGISQSITKMLEQTLYIRDLIDFLALKSSMDTGAKKTLDSISGAIRFNKVSFTYPGSSKTVLRDVSFEIKPGEVVALVGENGAGKTTIASLIARMYDPDAGEISVDGINLRGLAPDFLLRQIAFVFQSFNRYEATVEENVAYGNWEELLQDPAAIREIAQEVGIHEMIEKMPEKYQTQLGRRFGVYDLSGGQWQRIAIARSLARKAAILILDEPTASLDARAEYEIFSRFRQLAKGRTTILISHRFSTVSIADRIIVLENGAIVEQGTHAELLALRGQYAQLYHLHQSQMGSESDEMLPDSVISN